MGGPARIWTGKLRVFTVAPGNLASYNQIKIMSNFSQRSVTETTPVPAATPVAVLGTLAEFHQEPIPYDLDALVRLVARVQPDLLCLDMTPEQWQARDFGGLPPEYRSALLPLAHQTDMVVVAVAGNHPPAEAEASGWRGAVIRFLRRRLAALQRHAPSPEAINQGIRHHTADLIYSMAEWLAGQATYRAWKAHTNHLIRSIREVAQRDPGARVLVVVNVRHCHHIRRELEKFPEIRVVDYQDL